MNFLVCEVLKKAFNTFIVNALKKAFTSKLLKILASRWPLDWDEKPMSDVFLFYAHGLHCIYKTQSHYTIYTYKIYFIIIFSIFNF